MKVGWAVPGVWSLPGLILAVAACGDDSPTNGGEEPDPCVEARVAYPAEATQTGDLRFVHDPEIAREGDAYYVLSTNDGIPIRRSSDLLSWAMVGRVFPDQLPPWASQEIPGVEAPWAPGIHHFNDRWHLYYSLSTFGSQRSAIGLTTNVTLDPDAPDYQWEDRGKVLESRPGDPYNAIDPAVVEAGDGSLWLSWGSWWNGVYMRALDPATGYLSATDDSLYHLARRPVEDAMEAPYIIRRDGHYYLFVSFDLCCQGVGSTYNVRVGRSTDVTGPYLDRNGIAMTEGGGSMVLRGYGRIRGPGHNSVLAEGDGFLLVHHFYDAESNGDPYLQIRPLVWDPQGWPLAGLAFDGAMPGSPPADPTLSGEWGYWVGADVARRVELHADGTAMACDDEGTWSYDAPTLTVEWGAGRTDRSVLGSDGESFVGRTPTGEVVRGYRLGAGE